MKAPPPAVVAAFAPGATPVPLAGGRATTWRAGDVVLKPLDLPVTELRWQAEVLDNLPGRDFRVTGPCRTSTGELTVGGWSAWPWLAGEHQPRWEEIAIVGDRFHAALANLPRPAMLDARTHVWALADRAAWDEASPQALTPDVTRLLQARRPIDQPAQVIHGDLAGNVLFADGLPPAIIDVSPYWRPAAYAAAMIAVDAVAWFGADPRLLDDIAGQPDGRQLLIRALVFRLLSDSTPHAGHYAPALALALPG